MDPQQLFQDGILSQQTLEWFDPVWKAEQRDTEELRETAALQLFSKDVGEDDHEDDHEDDGTVETRSLTIRNITFFYTCGLNASGHGNAIWGASIAACLYMEQVLCHDAPSTNQLCVLELGAGAAIPSLFLANWLARNRSTASLSSSLPQVHITDLKQYHNIEAILLSVSQQSEHVQQRVAFRVSPHSWGMGIDGNEDNHFLQQECGGSNRYDWIIASDCIYNPEYHDALLASIAATLKKPMPDDKGGRAIVTFSLHGNVPEENVWAFFQKARGKDLESRAVKTDWNMEDTMKDLGIWRAKMDGRRWVAHIYELTWKAN